MGFSSYVCQILLLRAMTAAFSFGGFLASIVLGEVVKEEAGSQGKSHFLSSTGQQLNIVAFSLFASATFLGAMLGSTIGGYLAEPKGRIPFLNNSHLFQEKPYIGPGLVMGAFTVLCALTIWMIVPEVSSRLATDRSLTSDKSQLPEGDRAGSCGPRRACFCCS